MRWLRTTYRRCVDWVRSLLWSKQPATLDATLEAPLAPTTFSAPQLLQLRIRQETPPGIARLAVLLAECAHDTGELPSSGGLGSHAAADPTEH